MTPTEQWRPVPGFPGYVVSNRGRVRSMHRGRLRILTPWTNANGYLYLTLCERGVKTRRTVHGLVAEAFHGPRLEGQVVRHLDGHHQNNSADNLCFGSVSENSHDAVRHGTHAMVNRTHCPQGHPYSSENTRYYDGRRFCRTCPRERSQKQALRAAGIEAAS